MCLLTDEVETQAKFHQINMATHWQLSSGDSCCDTRMWDLRQTQKLEAHPPVSLTGVWKEMIISDDEK